MRREYLKPQGGVLPDGYVQLEYIETTGTQYINTGITGVTEKWSYEFDVLPTNTGYCGLRCILNTSGTQRLSALIGQNTGRIDYVCGGTGYKSSSAFVSMSARHIIKDTRDSFVIDGVNASSKQYATITSTNNLVLMAYEIRADYKLYSNGKWYGIKVYDESGHLRLDLTPALRVADNKPGLYDTTNNVFFINQGTEEFLYT